MVALNVGDTILSLVQMEEGRSQCPNCAKTALARSAFVARYGVAVGVGVAVTVGVTVGVGTAAPLPPSSFGSFR